MTEEKPDKTATQAMAGPPDDPSVGWKPNPVGDSQLRWWDGSAWTERVGHEETRLKATIEGSRTPTSQQSSGLMFAVGGFVALLVGSFGPWVTLGLLSSGGMDVDGRLTACVAIVGLVCLGFYSQGTKVPFALMMIIAFLGAAICAYDLMDILGTEGDVVFGVEIKPSVGWGLWLATAGGVASLGGLLSAARGLR